MKEDVKIIAISNRESSQDHPENIFNRVDMLVENDHKELFLVELQNTSESDYLLMLYGVSRAITNHMKLGDPYKNVRKVYSINIVYFGL